MSETTSGPCFDCGLGEYYEHDGWRFCNACGFAARRATWDRLSGLAARIAELEAENARGDALLRAVGTINAACTAKGGAGSTVLDERFIAQELEWGEVQYGSLEPALLALSLAAQLQEG